MRIFAIRDETLSSEKPLAYLVYLEASKSFYIEIADDADAWDLPHVLSSFARRNVRTIDGFWSRRWVQYRIVPPERQNIGQIIRDSGLKEYDEFSFLMRSMGRCEQDDCYLEEISDEQLPAFLLKRWENRIDEVIPLSTPELLLFCLGGKARRVNVRDLGIEECEPFLVNQQRFDKVEVQPGGFGVAWSSRALIGYRELEGGVLMDLPSEMLQKYTRLRLISMSEACRILNCSRQNVDDLIRRGKIHPIQNLGNNTLFRKAEIMSRRGVE